MAQTKMRLLTKQQFEKNWKLVNFVFTYQLITSLTTKQLLISTHNRKLTKSKDKILNIQKHNM